MIALKSPVQETLLKAKNFEVQRGLFAEGKKNQDPEEITRHFLAAAHLELVLAEDYKEEEKLPAAVRCWRSAACCFFRAGFREEAHRQLNQLLNDWPAFAKEIKSDLKDLDKAITKKNAKPRPTRKAKS